MMKKTEKQLATQIESIKSQLIRKYGAKKIILFGSAVTGQMTSDSDVDFLVVKDEKKDFHDRIVTVYRLIKKNIAADFVVYTPKEFSEGLRSGDPFLKSILSEGKVLYG